ncbi:hypothetical protein CC1G_00065 [Coprinopsis cinerea okayama7|uniref:Fe2OG dioxygenase domain-containing protein n=1 Tax=Coprinopsis cinerea (strain Okayama-7 / 130 / ATCC MYA-4618 / FGSC 9003) TaxID=240176 RepID=A8NWM1_COPC7|nr:hypothetical protein CC1G_00065 [Coprinopsis cinerea okayama7\|eukprot:XP_001836929.1 hypothetical protein CC1G_00065 [Coprinopsis cinerea okayama7\
MSRQDSALTEHLRELQERVEELVVPRHCYGTFPLEEGKAKLFYENADGQRIGRIDFAHPNGVDDAQLQDLVEACEPAKFGRGDQDVLDETYRKAWKLDAAKFATQFDVVNSGILVTVRDALLQYAKSADILEARLDKMNIYGPGSFFKPHVDTPRDSDMFATLVIVFPTEHIGGDLYLFGKKWLFESSKMVSKDPTDPTPKLAFVAFYSDIEHEVAVVESGYRVTVTYNLYCRKAMDPVGPLVSIKPTLQEIQIREAIRSIALNESAMPHGGILGFGLTHQYPIDVRAMEGLTATFKGVLKGSDAVIERACRALGFKVKVKALYCYHYGPDQDRPTDSASTSARDESTGSNSTQFIPHHVRGSLWLLGTTDPVPTLDPENGGEWTDGWSPLELDYVPGIRVKRPNWEGSDERSRIRRKPVWWVTRPNWLMESQKAYLAHGNETSVGYVYGTLVLTISIPEPAARKKILDGEVELVSDSEDSVATDNAAGGYADSD